MTRPSVANLQSRPPHLFFFGRRPPQCSQGAQWATDAKSSALNSHGRSTFRHRRLLGRLSARVEDTKSRDCFPVGNLPQCEEHRIKRSRPELHEEVHLSPDLIPNPKLHPNPVPLWAQLPGPEKSEKDTAGKFELGCGAHEIGGGS